VTDYAELEKRLREMSANNWLVGQINGVSVTGTIAQAADAISALTRELEEAKGLLRAILECDYDASETARGKASS